MFSASMITWLTPTISVGRAEGIITRHSFCRRVQPAIVPNSSMSFGTRISASVVARTIGGVAKMPVASIAETGLLPNRISIGIR